MAEFFFSMYIAYHDVKAWKFSRCGLAGNRGWGENFLSHFFYFLKTYLNTTNMNNLSINILSKIILRHYDTLKINSICVCVVINRRKSMFSSTQIINPGNRKWNKEMKCAKSLPAVKILVEFSFQLLNSSLNFRISKNVYFTLFGQGSLPHRRL